MKRAVQECIDAACDRTPGVTAVLDWPDPHRVDESIEFDELEAGVDFYRDAIAEFCVTS